MKEQVLDIFEEKNVHGAPVRLGKWIANVERLGIEAYQKVINTMRNYWYGIVNLLSTTSNIDLPMLHPKDSTTR